MHHDQEDSFVEIQCTVDDMTPELVAWTLERVYEAGAHDAFAAPIYKKKNRPALLISVLCPVESRRSVLDCIYAETTTLGVRWHAVHKHHLNVRVETVATPWGSVTAKVSDDGEGGYIAPEYEACRRVAIEGHVPLKVVYQWVIGQLSRGILPDSGIQPRRR